MRLYFSPGACSLSPHIVLREAGLPFEIERVDLATRKTASGEDFARINPKGYVPALQLDDGDVLTEGPAIVQFIADQRPESGLLPPPGSRERYHAQEWLNFISAEIHKSFTPLFKPGTPDDYKPVAKEGLTNRFGYLDRHLAGRQYLMGDRFTVADAYCFTVASWAKPVGIDLAGLSNLDAYLERIAARPTVQEALAAERGKG